MIVYALMYSKTLATVIFRVLGVTYLLAGLFYAPYVLLTAVYNDTLIASGLSTLVYIGPGICLLLLSKPLAALIAFGLERNSNPPPPPPNF